MVHMVGHGLEGGESLIAIASIDANGLSETSDGANAWKALLTICLVKFSKLLVHA